MRIKKRSIYYILLLGICWFGMAGTGYAQSNRFYYEQLSEVEKAVYKEIVENVTIDNRVVTIEWPTKIEFYTATKNDPDIEEKKQQSSEQVKQTIQNAVDALMQDDPMFFWMDIGATTEKWTFQGSGIIGNIRWKMMPIEISIGTDYTAQQVRQLRQRIDGIDVFGETVMQKLVMIHQHLCEIIEYDASSSYAHGPYGALVEGKAVCEGYARSFQLLCEREEIPCILVIGDAVDNNGTIGAHMWNYVQMEDGAWYAVDVTWDDQAEVMKEYFLVGSETKDRYFGGKKFSESHIPSGDFSGSGYKTFEYPPLNAYAYDPNKSPVMSSQNAYKQEQKEEYHTHTDVTQKSLTQGQQLLQTVDAMIDTGQKAASAWFDAILSSDIIYQLQTWIWFFIGIFLTVLFVVKEEMKK